MTTEQEKVLEAVQTALLIENDGKECYLQAAVGSKNEAGRKLLQSLAEEEDIHRNKLESIYNAVIANKSWPAINFDPRRGAKLRSLFAGVCQATGVNVDGVANEVDALNIALDKEKKAMISTNTKLKELITKLSEISTKR